MAAAILSGEVAAIRSGEVAAILSGEVAAILSGKVAPSGPTTPAAQDPMPGDC